MEVYGLIPCGHVVPNYSSSIVSCPMCGRWVISGLRLQIPDKVKHIICSNVILNNTKGNNTDKK